MADDVEGEGGCAANDQELRQVVEGRHDARCADRVEDVGGNDAEIRNLVEEWNKWNKEKHRNRSLVQEELRSSNSEIFNLLADPDLVERGGAEGQSRNDDAEKLGLGSFVDSEGNANAGREDGGKHVPGDCLAEEHKVDQDDARGSHDLGQLVETDRVVGQAKVSKYDVSGEESAHREHVPRVQAESLECAEGTPRRDEEDKTGGGEMPHYDHQLAGVELLIAEYAVFSLSEAAHAQIGLLANIPLAEENEAESRESVDGDPEAGNQLLLERYRGGLLLLLVLGEILDLGGLAGVDVVDEPLDGRSLLCCGHVSLRYSRHCASSARHLPIVLCVLGVVASDCRAISAGYEDM